MIVEPIETPGGLLETLRALEALPDGLPDVDDGLLPLDDVNTAR